MKLSRAVWMGGFFVAAFVAIAVTAAWWMVRAARADEQPVIALVVQGEDAGSVYAQVWLQAARELGIPVVAVTQAQLMSEWAQGSERYAGIILPDSIGQTAPPMFINGLYNAVEKGRQLMLVFDAATLTPAGIYPPVSSRLSRLTGCAYALYDSKRTAVIRQAPVYVSPQAAKQLRLAPGKAIRRAGDTPDGFALQLTTYGYDQLLYPSFATPRQCVATALMVGSDGTLVAGTHRFGEGQVLFVNLPLGYLKANTDAWLLHAFLQHFSREMVGLPQLTATPEAIGGLVMNLHIDSNASDKAMNFLEQRGLFRQGPYSIHVTAGPDMASKGDGLGVNLPSNEGWHERLRKLAEAGHQIGNHGGWIHNQWGAEVDEFNEARFAPYLQMNTEAVHKVTGRAVTEYSAPVGNHPAWVTRWLGEHGFNSYYSTSNNGSAPTRAFRAGKQEDQVTWSFPVMSYDGIASFEDATAANLPEQGMADWLADSARYVAEVSEARLIYFHPPGAVSHPQAMQAWLDETAKLQAAARFRWYTMSALATFLQRRDATRWQLQAVGDKALELQAGNDESLEGLAWRFPKSRFLLPQISAGLGHVRSDTLDWVLIAERGNRLSARVARIGTQKNSRH